MDTQAIWDEIRYKLKKTEIYKLLRDYNSYVIEVCDRQDGSVPVCLPEFYTDDWAHYRD